jgi:hypothetical protein
VNSEVAGASVGIERSKAARIFFSNLYDRRQDIARWLTLVGASLVTLTTVLLIFLAVLRSPVAAFLGVVVAAAARSLGQVINLRQLRRSNKPAELAAFEFQGEKILCTIDDVGILRYTTARKWRIFAALTGAGVCLAVQHLPVPEFHLLPEFVQGFHWPYSLVESFAAALPIFFAIVIFQVKGPESRWTAEARAAIDIRVAAAASLLFQRRELDGLAAGLEAMWRTLGVERRGEYRAAVAKYLGAHTSRSILHPETV